MTRTGARGVFRDATFQYGDCRDAAMGTMLRAIGLSNPEDVLFGEWFFATWRTGGDFRNLTVTTRQLDSAAVTEACGAKLIEHQADSLHGLHKWMSHQLACGLPVAVTVDHWYYEHSQFYRSGHMPHHLLVCEEVGDGYWVLDPYAYSPFEGEVSRALFAQWADSPFLAQARHYAFTLGTDRASQETASRYLAASWRDVIRHNTESMLGASDGMRGVGAIRTVADRLQEWIDSDGYAADIAARRKLPTTSFLEVGAIRYGHMMWLRRADAYAAGKLAAAARDMASIARLWNVVGAVRHGYQEQAGAGTDGRGEEFLLRKVGQMPRLIGLIADAEQAALERLAAVVP